MLVMGDFGEFLSCPLITAGLSTCTLYPEVRFRSFPLGFLLSKGLCNQVGLHPE